MIIQPGKGEELTREEAEEAAALASELQKVMAGKPGYAVGPALIDCLGVLYDSLPAVADGKMDKHMYVSYMSECLLKACSGFDKAAGREHSGLVLIGKLIIPGGAHEHLDNRT